MNILNLKPFGLFLEHQPGCECETCKPDPKDYEE